jgi:outer membrane protein assembly factor BamA
MNAHKVLLLIKALLLLTVCDALAQKTWRVSYDNFPFKNTNQVSFTTRQAAANSISNAYSDLLAEGYLDAKLDTALSDSVYAVRVNSGARYQLSSIQWTQDSASLKLLTEEWRKPRTLNAEIISSQIRSMLTKYENRGYPFAGVQITSIQLKDQLAQVTCKLTPGPLIRIDSVLIKSESKTPVRYVRNYLDIKKGDVYSEEKMISLEKKLKEIPFLRLRQLPEVRFKPSQADIFLFVEKKKANFFNGILGVRPDDVTGKVNFTGDVEIKLLNAFNTGEELYLNWRKMQTQTQDLASKVYLPYLFNTPIGVEAQLKIYKRDSTFTSIKSSAGLVFNFGGVNRLKAFVEKNATNQLTTFSTAQPLANVNSTFYGLALQIEKLDYRYNPQRGYAVLAEGATGVRDISAPNRIVETTSEAPVKRNVHRVDITLDYYIPTFKRQCIKIGGHGAGLFAPSIYDNEMFRIGGLRTLRGIDEETINSTSFAIGTLEYRFLFEQNSAFYVFADQGWYEKKGADTFTTDSPIGFGAGINFETKAGIFTFNYAIGQQFDNPILVRNAKVSFGFRNVF